MAAQLDPDLQDRLDELERELEVCSNPTAHTSAPAVAASNAATSFALELAKQTLAFAPEPILDLVLTTLTLQEGDITQKGHANPPNPNEPLNAVF